MNQKVGSDAGQKRRWISKEDREFGKAEKADLLTARWGSSGRVRGWSDSSSSFSSFLIWESLSIVDCFRQGTFSLKDGIPGQALSSLKSAITTVFASFSTISELIGLGLPGFHKLSRFQLELGAVPRLFSCERISCYDKTGYSLTNNSAFNSSIRCLFFYYWSFYGLLSLSHALLRTLGLIQRHLKKEKSSKKEIEVFQGKKDKRSQGFLRRSRVSLIDRTFRCEILGHETFINVAIIRDTMRLEIG